MQPSDEAVVGHVLHTRFLAGDRTVTDEIYIRYHPDLITHLRGYKYRKNLYTVDDEQIEDAAVEAMLNYLKGRDHYDPTKGKTLAGFLRMAAERDLLNILNKKGSTTGTQFVELEQADRNNQTRGEGGFADRIDDEIDTEARRIAVRAAAETDEERIVLDLMLDLERETNVYVAALGWTGRKDVDQAKRVNTIKDRLSKRLKRRFSERMSDGTAH